MDWTRNFPLPVKTLALLACLMLFLFLRMPGISLPYHQDEWKTAASADAGAEIAGSFFSHPPLTSALFRFDASLFGADHMRALPLLFGIFSFFLLFAVMRKRLGDRAAIFAVFLYAVSFGGIWSSLQLDTDGAILPAFFLLSLYCYDCFREGWKWGWFAALSLSLIVGFLVKLSFILVVGALLLEFLVERGRSLSRKQLLGALLSLTGFSVIAVLLLLGAHLAIPSFRLEAMIEHALQFFRFAGRNYTQIIVEGVKVLYYLSPLLIAPLVFLSRETFRATRIFFVYLLAGLLFYFVLFDFSEGALDKYLLFMVIPLSAICGAILSRIVETYRSFEPAHVLIGAVLALGLFLLALVPASVMPLYPKAAWFGAILGGQFNLLVPFQGGSGPIGFYISFLFIAASFLFSFSVALCALWKKSFRSAAIMLILLSGVAYNMVFAEEFSFGKLYGSAPAALAASLTFIEHTPAIESVLSFNDTGAWELRKAGKYAGRFYAAPQFEEGHRHKFSTFTGHYLVVGIPPLYDGFYKQFFSSCDTLYLTRSGNIEARVYACGQTKQ